jgi:hypothetical protein
MIGPKKLQTIREELRAVLGERGRDPIKALNELRKRNDGRRNQVIESLNQFLGSSELPKRMRPAGKRRSRRQTARH